MSDEPDNLASAGTDNVEPLYLDNPENWDFYDPSEDNEEIIDDDGTDDEAADTATDGEPEPAGAGEDDPEGEGEAEAADDEASQTPVTATEDAVVQLADGTTATVKDLIAGNMRQADYSRKSQENAQARKKNEADAQRIANIQQAFAEHLAEMMPQEPDTALAFSDPAKFTAQKAQYDAAMSQIQKIIGLASQPRQMVEEMSADARRSVVQEENTKLALMFPETGGKEGRKRFFMSAQEAAQEVGFSPEELSGVMDHRLFALAHWAQKGMAADKAKAAAKAKAQKAPPAAPRKPGQAPGNAGQSGKAMRNLMRDDSIDNAVNALMGR